MTNFNNSRNYDNQSSFTNLPDDVLRNIVYFLQGSIKSERMQRYENIDILEKKHVSERNHSKLMKLWRFQQNFLNKKVPIVSSIYTDILTISRFSRTCKQFRDFCSSQKDSFCRKLWENYYHSLFKPTITDTSIHVGAQNFFKCGYGLTYSYPGFDHVYTNVDVDVIKCPHIFHYYNLKEHSLNVPWDNVKDRCAMKIYGRISKQARKWSYNKADTLDKISRSIKKLKIQQEKLDIQREVALKDWKKIFNY